MVSRHDNRVLGGACSPDIWKSNGLADCWGLGTRSGCPIDIPPCYCVRMISRMRFSYDWGRLCSTTGCHWVFSQIDPVLGTIIGTLVWSSCTCSVLPSPCGWQVAAPMHPISGWTRNEVSDLLFYGFLG